MKEALIKHFSDVPLEQRFDLTKTHAPCSFVDHTTDRGSLRVLVPGSGLGRLAHDVASMGMFLF